MRLFITGVAATLVISMVAFVLSFQACNSVTQSIGTDTYDTIETDGHGGDTQDNVETSDDKTSETNKYKKVEWIVFDIDGEIVDRRFVNNI